MSACWITCDVSLRRSLIANLLLSTLFATSWTLQFNLLISSVTDLSFRSVVRIMSDDNVFCCFTYALKSSTVWMISFGTWASFTFVESFLPSAAFGWAVFMSIPPNPTVWGALKTAAAAVVVGNKDGPVRELSKLGCWGAANKGAAGCPNDSPVLGVDVVSGFNDKGAAAEVAAGAPKLKAAGADDVAAVELCWPKENPEAACGCPEANPVFNVWVGWTMLMPVAGFCMALCVAGCAPNDKDGMFERAGVCWPPIENPVGCAADEKEIGCTAFIGAVWGVPNVKPAACGWGATAVGFENPKVFCCCWGCWGVEAVAPKLKPLGLGAPNGTFVGADPAGVCVFRPKENPADGALKNWWIKFHEKNGLSLSGMLTLLVPRTLEDSMELYLEFRSWSLTCFTQFILKFDLFTICGRKTFREFSEDFEISKDFKEVLSFHKIQDNFRIISVLEIQSL